MDAADDPLPAEPKVGESAKDAIRPALSVEGPQGRLHVFLPFTPKLADYLDLLIAIEDTCVYLRSRYGSRGTAALRPTNTIIQRHPDPGVMEVNLPPAAGWDDSASFITWYSSRHSRPITAEKFMYDGKHTATGGGNHIVIGGPTAADSPLLRRPDFCGAWWLSGRIVHPYPICFRAGLSAPPANIHASMKHVSIVSMNLRSRSANCLLANVAHWMVDRLFRNLLVDITGNTHRAEFCIDKLYPPQGSGSRLGLLELRAFEMAPNVAWAWSSCC